MVLKTQRQCWAVQKHSLQKLVKQNVALFLMNACRFHNYQAERKAK